jgi:hypothetical protein
MAWQPAAVGNGAHRGRRSWSFRTMLAVVTISALALGAVFIARAHIPSVRGPGSAFAPGARPSSARPAQSRNGFPPPSAEEASSPLGHPAPLAVTSSSYAFKDHQQGSSDPITYDPCRPIHYVVNPERELPGAVPEVTAAIAAVSAATGLKFIYDGSTTETYSPQRTVYQPTRYGKRWAPLLVDFTDPGPGTAFTDDAVGVGGSTAAAAPADYHLTYVTGAIDIDTVEAARDLSDSSRVQLRAVLEHELGHVVGLGHVNDVTQLMNPSAGHGVNTYSAGDLTGLANLGTGKCQPGL